MLSLTAQQSYKYFCFYTTFRCYKILEEYDLNYDSYTQEEKDAINKAIGRYNGLLIKQGIDDAGNILKDFGERLPSLIEGFMSAFEDKAE